MEQSLGKLCELRDIARDLERNVRNSWLMILAPNIACVAGVFTLGFGIGMSVLTNNVASLAALANGLLPRRGRALPSDLGLWEISDEIPAQPAARRGGSPAGVVCQPGLHVGAVVRLE
jgi:hypothetical protein